MSGVDRMSISWLCSAARRLDEWFSVCQDNGFGLSPALTVPPPRALLPAEPELPQQDRAAFLRDMAVAEQPASSSSVQHACSKAGRGVDGLWTRDAGGRHQ
jgi:hypothetical protein